MQETRYYIIVCDKSVRPNRRLRSVPRHEYDVIVSWVIRGPYSGSGARVLGYIDS